MLPNSKRWGEEDVKISTEIENSILISLEEFEKINKIYKFVFIPKSYIFYDPKWHKTVARKSKNPILKNDDNILFSKDWIELELFRTGSHTLLNFCKNSVQCQDIYRKYKETKYKEWMDFKASLDRRRTRHELEETDTE